MRPTLGSRSRAEARRNMFRPQVQQLEDRLPPGTVLALPWSGLSLGGLDPDAWAPPVAITEGQPADPGRDNRAACPPRN